MVRMVVFIAVVFFEGGAALSQVADPQPAPSQPIMKTPDFEKRAQDLVKKQLEQLDALGAGLTDDQKQTITDAEVAAARAYRDVYEKMIELSKKRRDADPKVAEKAKEQLDALLAEQAKFKAKHQERFDRILTVAQKDKLRSAYIRNYIKDAAGPVELADQQIRVIAGKLEADAFVISNFLPNEKSLPMAGATKPRDIEVAIEEVMTPRQRTERRKFVAVEFVKAKFSYAKLTEEQLGKLQTAAEQIVKEPDLTVNQISDKLNEQVERMLTPEQREAVKPKNQR